MKYFKNVYEDIHAIDFAELSDEELDEVQRISLALNSLSMNQMMLRDKKMFDSLEMDSGVATLDQELRAYQNKVINYTDGDCPVCGENASIEEEDMIVNQYGEMFIGTILPNQVEDDEDDSEDEVKILPMYVGAADFCPRCGREFEYTDKE